MEPEATLDKTTNVNYTFVQQASLYPYMHTPLQSGNQEALPYSSQAKPLRKSSDGEGCSMGKGSVAEEIPKGQTEKAGEVHLAPG